jgi:hypothetical protein
MYGRIMLGADRNWCVVFHTKSRNFMTGNALIDMPRGFQRDTWICVCMYVCMYVCFPYEIEEFHYWECVDGHAERIPE